MVLKLPDIPNIFENSPEDGQVSKFEGKKEIPKNDDNTDTQTKEFWSMISGADTSDNSFPCKNLAALGGNGATSWIMPNDYNSIVEAVAVLIFSVTHANWNLDITVDGCTDGEATNTHNNSDAASTYDVVQNVIEEIDISSLFTGITAGDYTAVQVTNQEVAPTAKFLGVRIKYT